MCPGSCPFRKKHIEPATLPGPAEKLDILHMSIDELTTTGGYQFIGMDHFAKPDDELSVAQRRGDLHRNFRVTPPSPSQTCCPFGMTSITMAQDVYVQNHKKLKDYYRAVDAGELPIAKGVILTKDDELRRAVIMELMCQFELSKPAIEEKIPPQLSTRTLTSTSPPNTGNWRHWQRMD